MTTEPASPDRLRTVVVGASSGLGRSLAVGLAGRGARVALQARRLARIRNAGDATSLARVLDERHFDFRGDRPRLDLTRRSRLGD